MKNSLLLSLLILYEHTFSIDAAIYIYKVSKSNLPKIIINYKYKYKIQTLK